MDAELVWLDATAMAALIGAGEVTAVEIVEAHLGRIGAVDGHLNAFVTVVAEEAVAEARRRPTGPLGGVPFTVKDSFDTAGVRTARGSLLFADRVPHGDATAVARLRAAGAILLGKTNLPEMSYWTETDNLLTGRTVNPYDAERTPGGSSGGEGAAIAAGLSPLGIGSDVAISVRGPAHDTGIAAIKPTYGRVPTTGHFPDALRRWWHVGPMARSVRDLRLALSLMEGPDGLDPYATALPPPPIRTPETVRVGWTTDAFGPVDPEVAATVTAAAAGLADLGLEVGEAPLPWLAGQDLTRTSAVLFSAEMVPFLRRVTAGRESELHPVIARTLEAPAVTLADYLAAEHDVEELRAGFVRWFRDFDVLVCPVVTIPAPGHARSHYVIDGERVSARTVMRATVPFNLTGLPAVSLPFGVTAGGLPVGVQLVGRWWSDGDLLHLAERLEAISPVRHRHPAPLPQGTAPGIPPPGRT